MATIIQSMGGTMHDPKSPLMRHFVDTIDDNGWVERLWFEQPNARQRFLDYVTPFGRESASALESRDPRCYSKPGQKPDVERTVAA